MINSVRNTVLAIANKNNYGYISPQDFNLYAKQVQMDMFEDYFYAYNNWVNRENQRSSGKGYADIVKGLEEVIDTFSVRAFLAQVGGYAPGGSFGLNTISNQYALPSDYYLINKLYYYPKLLITGFTTATIADKLFDGSGLFNTIPQTLTTPPVNSIVVNLDDLTQARVLSVDSNNQLTLSADIMFINEPYAIYSNTSIVKVERVTQSKIFNLTSSNLTAPTQQFPAYILDGTTITVYPESIQRQGEIQAQYIRYPKDPKWTYQNLGGGGTAFPEEPLFDITQPDYQDFELPLSDEPTIVAKICQYIGIEIREADVYNFGKSEESLDTQETS